MKRKPLGSGTGAEVEIVTVSPLFTLVKLRLSPAVNPCEANVPLIVPSTLPTAPKKLEAWLM